MQRSLSFFVGSQTQCWLKSPPKRCQITTLGTFRDFVPFPEIRAKVKNFLGLNYLYHDLQFLDDFASNLDQCASLLQFRVGEVPGGRRVRLRFYFGCRLSFTGDEASRSRDDNTTMWPNPFWSSVFIQTRKYGYLWCPIFLSFGYERLCKCKVFRMTNIKLSIEFCSRWGFMLQGW